MAKYLIFLDIDGVLTSTRVHFGHTNANIQMWEKFDAVAVDFFNYIDATYDVSFVLMTTWKNGLDQNDPMIFHWVSSAFRNAGFRGTFPFPRWKTSLSEEDKLACRHDRSYEVKAYLEENSCEDFLLFDDTSYDFNKNLDKKRFIRTSVEDGLLASHMRNAKAMMGLWEKK